jgi:hypothetical protein
MAHWSNRLQGILGGLVLATLGAGSANAEVVNRGRMLGTPGSEERPAPEVFDRPALHPAQWPRKRTAFIRWTGSSNQSAQIWHLSGEGR